MIGDWTFETCPNSTKLDQISLIKLRIITLLTDLLVNSKASHNRLQRWKDIRYIFLKKSSREMDLLGLAGDEGTRWSPRLGLRGELKTWVVGRSSSSSGGRARKLPLGEGGTDPPDLQKINGSISISTVLLSWSPTDVVWVWLVVGTCPALDMAANSGDPF